MTCWQIPKPGARLLPVVLLTMALTLTGCDEKTVVEADESPVIRPSSPVMYATWALPMKLAR